MGFDSKFLWGVSSSGFQFEMGYPSGEGVDANTDWFIWVHDKENIRRGVVSGDFPENGVNYWSLYAKDHEVARKLGLNAYRIGLEWSRIFPKSTAAVEVGVERASDGYMLPESGFPPGVSSFRAVKKTAKNLAVAHARAYDAIKKFDTFRADDDSPTPAWVGLIHNIFSTTSIISSSLGHQSALSILLMRKLLSFGALNQPL